MPEPHLGTLRQKPAPCRRLGFSFTAHYSENQTASLFTQNSFGYRHISARRYTTERATRLWAI